MTVGVPRVHYLTTSANGKTPGSLIFPLATLWSQNGPLMALECHQSPLIIYLSVVDTRFTVAALVKVGRHQCRISYLKQQYGATRIRYLTTSDNGEPLGSTTLPLVIVESHQVHYLPLVTLGSNHGALSYL